MARLVGDFLEAFSMPIRTTGGCVPRRQGKITEESTRRRVLRSLRRTENTRMRAAVKSIASPRTVNGDFHEETARRKLEQNARILNTGLLGAIAVSSILRAFLKLDIKRELREFYRVSCKNRKKKKTGWNCLCNYYVELIVKRLWLVNPRNYNKL